MSVLITSHSLFGTSCGNILLFRLWLLKFKAYDTFVIVFYALLFMLTQCTTTPPKINWLQI